MQDPGSVTLPGHSGATRAHIWSNRNPNNPNAGPGELVVHVLSPQRNSRVTSTGSAYFLFLGGKGCAVNFSAAISDLTGARWRSQNAKGPAGPSRSRPLTGTGGRLEAD